MKFLDEFLAMPPLNLNLFGGKGPAAIYQPPTTQSEKIEGLERKIKSLRLQFETMKARLGDGPHIQALEEGTRIAVEELTERLEALRAGRPDPHE